MAQAMLFMERKGIISYEELLAKTTGYTERLDTLLEAVKEAFDDYKRFHGKDVPIPKSKELSAEYATVLERKKNNYSEYKKMKSEKQEWFIAEKIVQAILQEKEQKQEEKQKQKEQNEC